RSGTGRTSDRPNAVGRTADTECRRAPRTSASDWPCAPGLSSPRQFSLLISSPLTAPHVGFVTAPHVVGRVPRLARSAAGSYLAAHYAYSSRHRSPTLLVAFLDSRAPRPARTSPPTTLTRLVTAPSSPLPEREAQLLEQCPTLVVV